MVRSRKRIQSLLAQLHIELTGTRPNAGEASKSWATRLVLLPYFFFVLIILSSYTANLTAFLTVKRAAPAIASLDVRSSPLSAKNLPY